MELQLTVAAQRRKSQPSFFGSVSWERVGTMSIVSSVLPAYSSEPEFYGDFLVASKTVRRR
jgi:hypothetical protein